MVLDHIAQRPGMVVVVTAVFYAHLFGHGDLYMIDVAPVPNRFKKGIGKAKGQDILDRIFAQIMVNTIHLRLFKDTGDHAI